MEIAFPAIAHAFFFYLLILLTGLIKALDGLVNGQTQG